MTLPRTIPLLHRPRSPVDGRCSFWGRGGCGAALGVRAGALHAHGRHAGLQHLRHRAAVPADRMEDRRARSSDLSGRRLSEGSRVLCRARWDGSCGATTGRRPCWIWATGDPRSSSRRRRGHSTLRQRRRRVVRGCGGPLASRWSRLRSSSINGTRRSRSRTAKAGMSPVADQRRRRDSKASASNIPMAGICRSATVTGLRQEPQDVSREREAGLPGGRRRSRPPDGKRCGSTISRST